MGCRGRQTLRLLQELAAAAAAASPRWRYTLTQTSRGIIPAVPLSSSHIFVRRYHQIAQTKLLDGRDGVRCSLGWVPYATNAFPDQTSLEDPEAKEIRGTWIVKGLVLAMLTYIGMNVAPMMGDSMVRHSVALVKVKDPFLKRSGASRLTSIATNDAKRKQIVDAGGVIALMGMLETASDDNTRMEAVKALAMLSHYDPAVEAMHKAGGGPLVHSVSGSLADSTMQEQTSTLLEKMEQWNANQSKP